MTNSLTEAAGTSAEPGLRRRTLLLGAAATAAAPAMLSGPEASASTRWRMMPEPVRRPNDRTKPVSVTAMNSMVTVSSDPIPRTVLKDGRRVIHPTDLGNLLNAHVDSFELDGRREHLTLGVEVAEALMQRAVRHRGAAFIGYEFDWHDQHNPWFSAFGQSKFPRLLHNLGRHTGERRWQPWKREVLNAFRIAPQATLPQDPWIAGVDSNNCLWLEEYPGPDTKFSTVFNGHFYALAELSAYVTQSGDQSAADLVQGAAATMDFYRNICRSPGRFSNYFANIDTNVGSYHWINAACYLGLFNYTGVPRLATTVDQMSRDWPFTTSGKFRVRIRPRAQLITQRLDRAAVSWTPTQQLTVGSAQRSAIKYKPGVWAKMSDGPKAGWWILEQPASAYCLGTAVDRVDFKRTRDVWFNGGVNITGYRIAADGNPLPSLTRKLPAASLAHSTARARVAGSHHILIQDGAFKGLWIPESKVVRYR